MAIKLGNGVKAIGASLFDGKLSITIHDNMWLIPVPIKQNYGYQLNEHTNPNVFCYLTNDETYLIIRRDGTASLIRNKTNVLVKNFMVEIPDDLKNAEVIPGGSAYLNHAGLTSFLTLCVINDKSVGLLSIDNLDVLMTFDLRQHYSYVTDLSIQMGPSFPPLYWDNEKFVKYEVPNNPSTRMLYKIEGTVTKVGPAIVLN